MKILIKNANIISMSEKRERFEKNIDILICDNIIKKIGKNIQTDENTKTIDATGKIVLPGLINTHSHIAMSIFRETIDGYKLQQWLEEKIWPMEDKLQPGDIYYATYLSAIEMIKSGCTTINDMYFMTDYSINAINETGVRLQTTRTLMSMENDSGKRLKELEDLIEKNKDNPLVTFNVGIHGLYTTNEQDLIKYIEYAKNKNMRIHMHFCENSKEVQDIKNNYNQNPVQIIQKYFGDMNLILAHFVKLTDNEIESLSKMKNISVSHCPISNLKLGCGIAKIDQMAKKGINISLGTDGQGSGSNLDMFETMKITALLQKGVNEDPTAIPAYEVLKMATVNGAKALGLESKIGSIEENKLADIIIINPDTEQMQPINDIFADLVYNAKGSNVETTIVNGKILMENRKLNFCDEENIFDECDKIILGIKD